MSVRVWAAKALLRIDKEDAFSNAVVDAVLEKHDPKTEDRRLLTELVYGVLRHRRFLDYMLDAVSRHPMTTLDPPIVQVMRLSLYQLWFLDRIPAHAVLGEAGKVLRALSRAHAVGLCNAVLRELQRRKKDDWNPLAGLPPFTALAIEHSVPDWLLGRWDEELQAEGLSEARRFAKLSARAQAMNTPPALALWPNREKTTADALRERLVHDEVEVGEGVCLADALQASPRFLDRLRPLFEEGLCHVMDESAQCVAVLCGAKLGMRVLDLCAAPGGKSLALAGLVGKTGEVLAVDLHESRLRPLTEALERYGFSNVKTKVADATKPLAGVEPASFDIVLVDAPCSALGVARRHPEIKWKRTEQDAAMLAETGMALLRRAASYVKPGGALVYAVCTYTREETWEVFAQARETLTGFSTVDRPVDIPASLWHESAFLSRDVPTADTHFAFVLRRDR